VTVLHLYGVLDAGDVPPVSMRGLDGRTVRVLLVGDRCAWVSDVAESRLEATTERIREHDAVLRGATEVGYSVVPSLFGRLHANEATLIAALELSSDALETGLALVRGRVEMSLLVAPSGAPPSSVDEPPAILGPGHQHLLRIRNQVHGERLLRDTAFELAQSATRLLGDLFVAERVVENPAPPILAARAHLVARDDIARYLRAVKSIGAAADLSLRVAVRGPGAAYSFAAVQIA
jgi:hypothetical protein